MSMDMLLETEGVPIYIPIWFYSNKNRDAEVITLGSFTFQYGSIQIASSTPFTTTLGRFTFQYGSIQIADYTGLNIYQIDLHSNMVLFKSNSNINATLKFTFTFQYGSIQIQSLLDLF